jgi:hypothetical protein
MVLVRICLAAVLQPLPLGLRAKLGEADQNVVLNLTVKANTSSRVAVWTGILVDSEGESRKAF